MAFVVCEPCRDCKYTDCVTICPCECFYQDEHMLYIDSDTCIDCGACVAECPVAAIFPDGEVPAVWQSYVTLNRERARELIALRVGHITDRQEPKRGASCRQPS